VKRQFPIASSSDAIPLLVSLFHQPDHLDLYVLGCRVGCKIATRSFYPIAYQSSFPFILAATCTPSSYFYPRHDVWGRSLPSTYATKSSFPHYPVPETVISHACSAAPTKQVHPKLYAAPDQISFTFLKQKRLSNEGLFWLTPIYNPHGR
jgi:hypothetical protein